MWAWTADRTTRSPRSSVFTAATVAYQNAIFASGPRCVASVVGEKGPRMIRAFLAVELPRDCLGVGHLQQDVKRQLERTAGGQVRISWVRPASMHLTLRFLGDMPDESIDPLQVAIQQAVSVHQPIHLPLERLGVFPSSPQPRVLWAGPSESWEQGPDAQRLSGAASNGRGLLSGG